MPTQFTITYEKEVAIIKIIGEPTLQDFRDIFEKLSLDGKFAYSCRLWDLRECLLTLSSQDMQRIADRGKRAEANHAKVAILATHDITFGVSRMHQVFRESELTEVSVFRHEAEAMVWLLSD